MVKGKATMVELGQFNHLRVTKQVDFGVYLDGQGQDDILLPRRYVPEGCQIGDELKVFVYRDSEDRIIATTLIPKALVGQCAVLEVVSTTKIGAFLDWGLPKDLFVPLRQQAEPMRTGSKYVVYLYIEHESRRIAASSRLDKFLPETSIYYREEQEVKAMVYAQTDLGYKVVIDNAVLGLIYKNEVFQPLDIGSSLTAYIKGIRSDHKLDVTLQKPGSNQVTERAELTQRILDHLQASGGVSPLTDKSPPEQIYAAYHVSKGSYKKAIGALYKQRKIIIEKEFIALV